MDGHNEDFWKALDELVNDSEIIIDRPKGTAHPKYPEFIYKVDYGYLKDTSSMDGGGIDVWVGSGEKKIDAIMCIVDLLKKDSEIKILMGLLHQDTSCWQQSSMMLERAGSISVIGQARKALQTKRSGSCLMSRTVMLS